MNKSKNFLLLISFILLCALAVVLYKMHKPQEMNQPLNEQNIIVEKHVVAPVAKNGFSDGLPTPDSIITHKLDEFGMGPSVKYIYYIDINKDGKPDKITKTLIETGNAHSYYEYTLAIKQGDEYIDITPNNFATINGEPCDLQQIQFGFVPQFRVKLIYRELGDSWLQPTVAKQKIFLLNDNELKTYTETELRPVCDVKELF